MFFVSPNIQAQGTFLSTGEGQAFTTRQVMVDYGSSTSPVLEFNFGFATDEIFSPNQLFDSFTVTLANMAGDTASILVTADASGFAWAPPSGAGFPFRGDDISREEIPFPDAGRTYRTMAAYKVSLPIPSEFGGQGVSVTFDLIDNMDAVRSLGFFTAPAVVPEPAALALMALGAGAMFVRPRARK